MNEDLIISPLFPALYIIIVVSFIVFRLTGDFKLGLSLGFSALIILVIYFKRLDSHVKRSNRRKIPNEAIRSALKRRYESRTQEYDTDNRTREGRFIKTILARARIIGTFIVAVIIALFIAIVLNLANYLT